MDKNLKVNLSDQAVKGSVLGALVFFGNQAGISAEQVAVAMPVVLVVLAWVSTKIGDKGTTALFSAIKQISDAQSKKANK